MSIDTTIHFSLSPTAKGQRIDLVLATVLPDYSRATLQEWLKNGAIQVNGKPARPKDKVQGKESIIVSITSKTQLIDQAENIPIDKVFEDDDLLVINKPPGLVVHPGAGNHQGTLLNALLYHFPSQQHLPRAGIIHRIDKDTSGLLVIAKTLPAFHHLTNALKNHDIKRIYHAIVVGTVVSGGQINAPIGRHKVNRLKMAVVPDGKPAISDYRLIEKFAQHTYVKVMLQTGRTHQIRVHFAHIGHPLVGDPLYNSSRRQAKGASATLQRALQDFPRQALHAHKLLFTHPITGEAITCVAPLPDDFQALRTALRTSND